MLTLRAGAFIFRYHFVWFRQRYLPVVHCAVACLFRSSVRYVILLHASGMSLLLWIREEEGEREKERVREKGRGRGREWRKMGGGRERVK